MLDSVLPKNCLICEGFFLVTLVTVTKMKVYRNILFESFLALNISTLSISALNLPESCQNMLVLSNDATKNNVQTKLHLLGSSAFSRSKARSSLKWEQIVSVSFSLHL